MKNGALWLAVLVLIAFVVILWQCPASLPDNRVAELQRKLDSTEARFKEVDDSTKKEVALRDSIITDLTAEKEILSGELKVVSKEVTELTKRVRRARVIRDTVEFYVSCDSLAQIADELTYLLQEYEYAVDSLIFTYGEQLAAKDSQIKSRDQLYSEMRISFNTIASDYNNLYSKYGKEQKKLKASKKLNVILGSAVIVLSGILIAK